MIPVWGLYAVGAGALALFGAIGWLKYENTSLERDLAKRSAELTTCAAEKEDLQDAIRERNRAVAALGEATAAARAQAVNAEKAADEIGKAAQGLIESLQAQIQKPKATACAPAIAEIRRLLK